MTKEKISKLLYLVLFLVCETEYEKTIRKEEKKTIYLS